MHLSQSDNYSISADGFNIFQQEITQTAFCWFFNLSDFLSGDVWKLEQGHNSTFISGVQATNHLSYITCEYEYP